MSGHEVDFFLPVVCTDRHQHPAARLTTVIRQLNGELSMSRALEAFAPPMGDEAEPATLMSRDSYTFFCKRCGRTPVVSRDRWWQLPLLMVRANISTLDVSFVD